MRVLVIEDDLPTRDRLIQGLSEEGFAVDADLDGVAQNDPSYDLILMGLMPPGTVEKDLLRGLRARGVAAPVLVLTEAEAGPPVLNGAADYLAKPFTFEQLLARGRELMSQPRNGSVAVLRVGPLTLDRSTRQVRWRDQPVELSAREVSVLEFFMRHAGEALSRKRIYEGVWSDRSQRRSNLVDVNVAEIRRQLARVGAGSVIATVRGVGYRLENHVLVES